LSAGTRRRGGCIGEEEGWAAWLLVSRRARGEDEGLVSSSAGTRRRLWQRARRIVEVWGRRQACRLHHRQGEVRGSIVVNGDKEEGVTSALARRRLRRW
jgi:hypothetical protein